MAGKNVNRTTSGIVLPSEVSGEIWTKTIESSAAMQFATKVDLPGAGVTVETITGDPVANWVAETDEKPVSSPTFGSKQMQGYTLAVIVPFSNQFKRDKAKLFTECVRRLPAALGKKFDATVFGPQSGAPGSNFDTLGGAASFGIAGTGVETYDALVDIDAHVAAGDGILDGWVLAPQAKTILLKAKDADGRALLSADGSVTSLLGAPVSFRKAVYLADADGAGAGTAAQIGFAGDWSYAAWGQVDAISISTADQATINDGSAQLNLWQRNMFAVRVEIEVGFRVRDLATFAKITDDDAA